MPVDRDDTEERNARIDRLVEDARKKTPDVRNAESGKSAIGKTRRPLKTGIDSSRERRRRDKQAG